MSAINGIGGNVPLQKVVSQPIQKELPTQPIKQNKLTDKVQLSGMSHVLQTLKAGGDVRTEKVAAIRQQIQAGTYETEAKLDAAIDRLMNDLAR